MSEAEGNLARIRQEQLDRGVPSYEVEFTPEVQAATQRAESTVLPSRVEARNRAKTSTDRQFDAREAARRWSGNRSTSTSTASPTCCRTRRARTALLAPWATRATSSAPNVITRALLSDFGVSPTIHLPSWVLRTVR